MDLGAHGARLTTETGMTDPALTERQMEIVALVAEGLSNAEIAERVYLQETTVKNHLTRIYNMLGFPLQMGGGNRVRVAAYHWKRGQS